MSRNHLNVLSADVIVALPGGAGTRPEIELALEYRRRLLFWLVEEGSIPGIEEAGAPLAGAFAGRGVAATRRLRRPRAAWRAGAGRWAGEMAGMRGRVGRIQNTPFGPKLPDEAERAERPAWKRAML